MRQNSNFLLNFFSLNVASIAVKILNFLLFLFLVRVLSIEEYGMYVLVWTQVNFFTPLLDFGTTSYGLIYMSEDKKQEINSLVSLRFCICAVIYTLVLLSSLLYRKDTVTSFYIFLMSFAIFANVAYGSLVIYLSLKQKAYLASLLSLSFTIVLVAVSIGILLTTQSLTHVFIGTFLMYLMYSVLNFFIIRSSNGFRFKIETSIWKEIIKKSYVFVLISFFLGIYFKIDIFLLRLLKSEIDVGIYSAGYKFFESLLFIIGSYNIAATPQLAKLFKENKDAFLSRIKKDGLLLMLCGVGIACTTYIIAPILLSTVLKEHSVEATKVLRIVITTLPFMLLSTILINGLYIMGKAKIIIIVYLVQIIINIALNLLLIPKYTYIASSYITVGNEMLNLGILLFLFIFYHKHENKR